jgi:hypothetical protein
MEVPYRASRQGEVRPAPPGGSDRWFGPLIPAPPAIHGRVPKTRMQRARRVFKMLFLVVVLVGVAASVLYFENG